jgi:putative MATE family efflux protein
MNSAGTSSVLEAEPIPPLPMPSRREMRRDLYRLSWPCAVELILGSLIGVITMVLISSLGKEAVSAIGITNQPIMIPNVVIQAFCVGGTALVARSLGSHDEKTARQAAEQTLLLSIAFGLITSVILYIFGDFFILWLGATPDYFQMASLYMRYCAIGSFFQSITNSIAALLRGAGRTRLSMYFNVIANIVNVILGYTLIHGIGPIPSLGVLGASIAQLVAKVTGCILALWIILRPSALVIRPRIKKLFVPLPHIIKRVCRIGASTAGEQVALRVGLTAFTVYVVSLGTAEYAAHNIASSIHGYVVNFGQAIGIALVSLVGQNLGAGRPDIADRYFSEAMKLSLLVSAVLMALLLIFPVPIARIFSKEADVIANISTALRILALFAAPQIVQMAFCGGLRGGGDTKWPLISTMVGVLGMRMVMGYFFVIVWKMGLAGAWYSWLLDQTVRATIIYFRYKSGKWKHIKV